MNETMVLVLFSIMLVAAIKKISAARLKSRDPEAWARKMKAEEEVKANRRAKLLGTGIDLFRKFRG